jgi:hypothetical protein
MNAIRSFLHLLWHGHRLRRAWRISRWGHLSYCWRCNPEFWR